jgi:serine phosphatase RsbU (regulator of sigma subunit)
LFLAYSDGLVESRERGLEEGMAQMLAEAARLSGRGLGQLLDDLLAEMLAAQLTRDDVTLLALRYQGDTFGGGPR